MLKHSSQKLPQRILLGLMVAWVCRLLLDLLVDDFMVWQSVTLAQGVMVAILASLAVSLLPYRDLRSLCLVSCIAGFAWADVIFVTLSYLFHFQSYNVWIVFVLVSSAMTCGLYWLRSYDQKDHPLDGERIFLLRLKPKDRQSFLISLLGWFGPFGGYALYYRGVIYSFRKGTFQKRVAIPFIIGKYHIADGRIPVSATITDLESMIGSRWKLTNNCLRLKGIWNAARP